MTSPSALPAYDPRRGRRRDPDLRAWPLGQRPAHPALGGRSFPERWVYCSANLLVDQNVDKVVELIDRSAKSGYTAIMLADYKFQILDRMDERYFRNAERVKSAAAARPSIEIIPAVFSIGYSNGILAHDPNLAEGIEAKQVPHVVRDRRRGARADA